MSVVWPVFFVSRGIGVSIVPVRIGVPPEVVVVELVHARSLDGAKLNS